MYRGVYPIFFDVMEAKSKTIQQAAFDVLMREDAIRPGDRVLFTMGEAQGVTGGTNTMQILTVPGDPTS